MKSNEYCSRIDGGLSRMVFVIQQNSKAKLYSVHKHAENFILAFLNQLNGWKLVNANADDPNAAGIDLIYTAKNETVVVQVSSDAGREKVQESLKKSARFAGAHFYFAVLGDRHPKYQKEFENYGLVFDFKNDVLATPELFNLAVNCEARDGLDPIDIQKKLAELTEKYFPPAQLRDPVPFPRLGSGAALNQFEYNRNIVRLYGRETEMARLREFLAQEALFGWWAITAPGGAGKTRLAYELQNRLLEEGQWDVRVIPASTLNASDGKLSELSELCPGRTLLIVDYVQQHTEALKTLLERLSEPELQREAPLRLLLLERDVRDENDRIVWLDKLLGTDHHIIDTFYTQKPLELQPLSAKEGEADPLEQLIREFADWLCDNSDEKEPLHPLPVGKETELRKKLEDIDPGLLRPLYAMILTDAWVQDPETEHWSQEKLLSHIVRREWDMAAKRLEPYKSNLLPSACRILWCVATVFSAGGAELTTERIRELLPKQWGVLSRTANAAREDLESWDVTPEELLLTLAGIFADGKFTPLRPDLLGEFFVLRSMEKMGSAEKTAFYTAVLGEIAAARIFFGRMLNDYGKLLTDEPKRFDFDQAFPPEPKLDREHTARYARLLRRLFENSRSRDVRTRLAASLTALAAEQTAEDAQTGRILNDAALVLEAAGDYHRALKFFEKAVAITEKVHGKEHTDTAASYNNIALVYDDIGDYPKALEFHEKALAIREKLLGTEHPSTATSFNNIANVYYAMGDYPKALEFHEKALAITEKLLGTEHPSTATSYNNIASVYRAMGDYPKALKFQEKDLEITEKLLGTEHPDTAASYNNIASVYRAMGEYAKALKFHEKALVITEKLLGTEHPSTALSYHNLSGLYYETHELAEALRYSDLALPIFQRVLGAEHPNTKIVKKSNEFLKRLSAQQE